ncbi:unnamed protein product [Adineta steineri]|uniref:Uncharacterized protein n=1 Tax=Adineta steineri TaxID=433720 RepID=A0A814Q9F5_9BILA|nr:unnamed protein product [Adineta steineri]CAF1116176.1 unnamed protein product [Adineta steineri]CAF3727095.1 unnamed protein product [Adineta steineri]CAF3760846.1 unnamed protein product [Adineta steineri]
MERISNRTNNENSDRSELPPPPPYTSVIYKTDNHNFDSNLPPNYSDAIGQSVVYINNYPGPPITDGYVQTTQDNISTHQENFMSKTTRIYLIVNALIMILFGLICVGIQIGILTSHSIIYYYYGFWGGGFLVGIGITILILFKRRNQIDYTNIFYSFFWHTIFVGIVFAVGLVIVFTDKCDDNATENVSNSQMCRHSYKLLNGILLGSFALALVQSITNTIVFGCLKRRHSIIPNSIS